MARDPKTTSKIMSCIKSKNTRPEITLRKALWAAGLRFRVNIKIHGIRPDIVFTRAKIAVFCDGDFWHGHNWAIRGFGSLENELSHYSEYWKTKILNNIKRDNAQSLKLSQNGWTVIRFWGSDIKTKLDQCVVQIIDVYTANIEKQKSN